MNEFDIPKFYDDSKIIGNFGTRLMLILGTKLEGANEHGINRYTD